jgi:hypothetical protein
VLTGAAAAGTPRAKSAKLALVSAALPLIALVVLSDRLPDSLAPIAAVTVVAVAAHRTLLSWPSLLGGLLLIILFVPIRRYAFPGGLPFELEPYRLYVMMIAVAWVSSLLIDRRVRVRSTGLEPPLFLFLGAVVISIAVNSERIQELALGDDVAKKMTFFLSWVAVLAIIASVVKDSVDVDRMLKVLVGGGAVLAFLAIVESRTGANAFNGLNRLVPILSPEEAAPLDVRGGQIRAYASAQHPIALGALLAMMTPLGVYLGRRYGGWWWLAPSCLAVGALATVSRTAIVMLVVAMAVFAFLQPAALRRLWPFALPLLLAAHLFLPGTVGTVRDLFFPEEGLVAQQQQAGPGSARISSLGPALDEWSKQPLTGIGYGTRIPEGPRRNSIIYDDEWLSTLVETGAIGAGAWLWLFVRASRRLGRASRRDPTDRGWLLTALTASVIAYAVGMIFYDAFSFIQVSIVLFIVLGLGAVTLRSPPGPLERPGF